MLRVLPWLRPHGFLGRLEYDDGVYYAAGKLLLHGQLPYRDVTLLHPPGVPVVMAPFAALGGLVGDDLGLAAARVAVLAVAVANMLLVHRAVGRRAGLAAAAVYAVAPTAVIAEHTVLLEPLVTLLCGSATLLLLREAVTRRQAVLAGLLLAAGLNIKVFAAAYVLVLLASLLVGRRRLLLPVGYGLAVGGVLDLAALAVAPRAFVRDVVTTQLSRPADATADGAARVAAAFGLDAAPLVLALVLLAVLAGTALVVALRAPSRATAVWAALTVFIAVALARSPSFFPHYGAVLAAPFAVTVGRAVAVARPRAWPAAVVAVSLAVLAVGSVRESRSHPTQPDPGPITAAVATGDCVFAETASLAIAADLLRVPTAACPAWIDGRGVRLTYPGRWPRDRPFYPDGFTSSARWQSELVAQLDRAQWLLLIDDPARIAEWSGSTRSYALSHFHRVPGRRELWRRD